MSSQSTTYICSKCDAQSPKWQGRCLECGSWGTLTEGNKEEKKRGNKAIKADEAVNLNEIDDQANARLKTNISELDRVLGGGVVVGSLILLGGDPGIGKSTLALQIAKEIKNTLYVSGEESAKQVKIRAERLNIDLKNLQFLPQTNIEKVIATIRKIKPPMVIIDSIQTMNFSEATGGIGSVSQILACAGQLLETAKQLDVSIIIIGHVTKGGVIAGPKAMEHLVDTVVYLENDKEHHYKILRSVKNRFGSTGEIGVFQMANSGLQEVSDPTKLFVSEKPTANPGVATSIVMEGSRPFLVEVQSLVSKTNFGYPQRKTTGFDNGRLQMLIAVLSKVAKINLGNQDIYLNIAGGLKIKEPAMDLAVCLAVASAYLEIPINQQTAMFGEVGLSGEIRAVSQSDQRIKEAKRLNFNKLIIPQGTKVDNTTTAVSTIQEAIATINKKK